MFVINILLCFFVCYYFVVFDIRYFVVLPSIKYFAVLLLNVEFKFVNNILLFFRYKIFVCFGYYILLSLCLWAPEHCPQHKVCTSVRGFILPTRHLLDPKWLILS